MSLTKVNYIDNSTIITAQNLNDIQDNIIQNAELIAQCYQYINNTEAVYTIKNMGQEKITPSQNDLIEGHVYCVMMTYILLV